MNTTRTITAALALASLLGSTSLTALPVFSVAGGGISIGSQDTTTAGTSAGTAWTVSETMTSSGTLALTDTDGNPLVTGGHISPHSHGAWFTKTVLNDTGTTWTSFELELQEILGTPSGEGDGLSFAQGSGLVFSSSVFSGYTRIDDTRDYLNFSGGVVLHGESVSFTFAITDNAPQSTIYLLQTANKIDTRVPDVTSTALLLVVGLSGMLGLRRKFC